MAVVIKYGGNAMTDPVERREVTAAIRAGAGEGLNPIVVHGGGPFIERELERDGIEHRFIRGLRVTTRDGIVAVERALTLLGKELAAQIGDAIALTGRDCNLLLAEEFDAELGRVGRMVGVNARLLDGLIGLGTIPVLACLALDARGEPLNVNADEVAGAVAAALGAPVFFLTNVPGVLDNPDELASVLTRLSHEDAVARIADGRISGGMIPKVEAALRALAEGAPSAVIGDGRTRESFLAALRGQAGTVVAPN